MKGLFSSFRRKKRSQKVDGGFPKVDNESTEPTTSTEPTEIVEVKAPKSPQKFNIFAGLNCKALNAIDTSPSIPVPSLSLSEGPEPPTENWPGFVDEPKTPPRSPKGVEKLPMASVFQPDNHHHQHTGSESPGLPVQRPVIRSPEITKRMAAYEKALENVSPIRHSDSQEDDDEEVDVVGDRSPKQQQPRNWNRILKKQSSDSSDDEDLVKHDVLRKKKWLERAFTPTGGGNMEDPTEDMTETEQTESSTSPENNFSTDVPLAPARDYTPPKRLFDHSGDEARIVSPNDRFHGAYQVWHKKGLLTWRPTSNEDASPTTSDKENGRDSTTAKEKNAVGETTALAEELSSPNDSPRRRRRPRVTFDDCGNQLSGPPLNTSVSSCSSSSTSSSSGSSSFSGTTSSSSSGSLMDDSLLVRYADSRQESMLKSKRANVVTWFGGAPPSLSPASPSSKRVEAYKDFVKAYKTYAKKRSPENAVKRREAHNLLAVSKAI